MARNKPTNANPAAAPKPVAPPAVMPRIGDTVLVTDESGEYPAIVSKVYPSGDLGLHVLIASDTNPVVYNEAVGPERWKLRDEPKAPPAPAAVPAGTNPAAPPKPKRTFGQVL